MSEHRVAVYLDIENLCQPYRVEGRLSQGITLMSGLLGALRRTTVVVSALGVCDREMWRRVAFPLHDLGVRVFSHAGGGTPPTRGSSTTSAGSCLPRSARS